MYVGVKIKDRESTFYKTVSNNVTEVKLICEKNDFLPLDDNTYVRGNMVTEIVVMEVQQMACKPKKKSKSTGKKKK